MPTSRAVVLICCGMVFLSAVVAMVRQPSVMLVLKWLGNSLLSNFAVVCPVFENEFSSCPFRIDLNAGHPHQIQRFVLTRKERDALYTACPRASMPGLGSGNSTDYVMQAHTLIQKQVPDRMKALFKMWRSNPHAFNGLVVDNIVFEPALPATPVDGKREGMLPQCSELILTGIAATLGQPFSFAAEKPWLVNDLTPMSGMENATTNAGSRILPWHTEHAATGFALGMGDILVSELVLGVLRAAPSGDGKTLVADIRDAIDLLSETDIALLEGPNYYLRLPPSMQSSLRTGSLVTFGPRPLLFGPMFEFRIIGGLYPGGVHPISTRAKGALENLRSALDRVQQQITSRPGRVMILNNRLMVHARGSFTPSYDGHDRWLQRVLVTQHLSALKPWLKQSDHIVFFE